MINLTREIDANHTGSPTPAGVEKKIEVIVMPVSDVDRAKEFYVRLGWRLDQTFPGVVQLTAPGSECSLQFGAKLTTAAPGSAKGYMIVSDIEAARKAIMAAGIQVGEIFHIGAKGPVLGPDPERRRYRSLALFSDPDGNSWVLQEITARPPAHSVPDATSFSSATDLESRSLRASADAHRHHESWIGQAAETWPDWYAEYMVRGPARTQLLM